VTTPLDDPVFESAGEHESVALLRRAIEIVESARPLPLSSSVRIEPNDVLDLLHTAVAQLPEELRQARWLLKERDEFLAKVQSEADDILEEARVRAEQLVSRQEIVRQARHSAKSAVETAEADARRMRHEAEDWVDKELAKFEIVLDRTIKTVQAGREKLRVTPLPEAAPGDIDHIEGDDDTDFFDQDI
jgi:vacuolar-type H+-ATPase subunit H